MLARLVWNENTLIPWVSPLVGLDIAREMRDIEHQKVNVLKEFDHYRLAAPLISRTTSVWTVWTLSRL